MGTSGGNSRIRRQRAPEPFLRPLRIERGPNGGRAIHVEPESPPRRFIYPPSGPLDRALAEAREGDTLLLHPGVYPAPFGSIEKSVALIGLASTPAPLVSIVGETQISADVALLNLEFCGGDPYVLTTNDADVILSGVRTSKIEFGDAEPLVWIAGGRAAFEDCEIHELGAGHAAVSITASKVGSVSAGSGSFVELEGVDGYLLSADNGGGLRAQHWQAQPGAEEPSISVYKATLEVRDSTTVGGLGVSVMGEGGHVWLQGVIALDDAALIVAVGDEGGIAGVSGCRFAVGMGVESPRGLIEVMGNAFIPTRLEPDEIFDRIDATLSHMGLWFPRDLASRKVSLTTGEFLSLFYG